MWKGNCTCTIIKEGENRKNDGNIFPQNAYISLKRGVFNLGKELFFSFQRVIEVSASEEGCNDSIHFHLFADLAAMFYKERMEHRYRWKIDRGRNETFLLAPKPVKRGGREPRRRGCKVPKRKQSGQREGCPRKKEVGVEFRVECAAREIFSSAANVNRSARDGSKWQRVLCMSRALLADTASK